MVTSYFVVSFLLCNVYNVNVCKTISVEVYRELTIPSCVAAINSGKEQLKTMANKWAVKSSMCHKRMLT